MQCRINIPAWEAQEYISVFLFFCTCIILSILNVQSLERLFIFVALCAGIGVLTGSLILDIMALSMKISDAYADIIRTFVYFNMTIYCVLIGLKKLK